MRSIVLHRLGELRVEDRPRPVPGAGEVLIEVVATGICGSDIHGYTGENGRRHPGQVMGHESSGRVAAVGPDVTGLELGRPVTFNPVLVPATDTAEYRGREQHSPSKTVLGVAPERAAAFADYVLVPARNTVPLPADLPIEQGALIEPLAVALHAVRRAAPRGDDRVVVFGGGPIGQSVVLALRLEGVSRIVVSEPDAGRRELCASLGAVVVDPGADELEDALAALGGAADVAIDAVGIDATLAGALAATRLGATIVLVGMGARRLAFDAFLVSTEERTLVGSFTYTAQDFLDVVEKLGQGLPGLDRLISREVPPEEADAAFAALAAGDGTPGKVLVRFAA